MEEAIANLALEEAQQPPQTSTTDDVAPLQQPQTVSEQPQQNDEAEEQESFNEESELAETAATAVAPASSSPTTPTPSPSSTTTTSAAATISAPAAVVVAAAPAAPAVPIDTRDHVNLVFIGHVDAGKSTLSGQILFLTGRVDQRTIEKYEREAKQKNRESWFYAFILDSNEEERVKGITIEVGRGYFDTNKKRYTILDAPGHKDYVPNMIGGASQADVAILVISARKGEFETGFERGGQTREHAMLVKTLGVKYMIVLVNKMDEPTVQWSQARYNEIVDKLTPFLRETGFNPKQNDPKRNVTFLPVSGFSGANIKERADKSVCSWYSGPSLLEFLDDLESINRSQSEGPLRIPVTARYKEMGFVFVLGKVESGSVRKGDKILLMPGKLPLEVVEISDEANERPYAIAGDNIKLKVTGADEENIQPGFVLCDMKTPVPCVKEFLAHFRILDIKSIFSAGFSPVLHVHTASEECIITKLVAYLDKKTGKPIPNQKPKFCKSGDLIMATVSVNQAICIEKFDDIPQLGRFTLRDGKTIAIGKIVGLKKPDAPSSSTSK